ncbi:ABC transporter substrate-binding protein [Glaciihabitans tibetensis]|nr:ABC transporter substrate-binding protein [Glaciihabitans tibetensis]
MIRSAAAPRTARRKSRRLLSSAAVALTVTILVAGCSSSSGAPADDGDFGELSIQLSWVKDVEFAGEYMADSKGYYEDAGFSSVNLVAGPGATESLVASGQMLVGITDPISAAPAIVNEDAPIKIIGTTYQKNPFSILSLKDKGNIVTPDDLVGKRIGVQAGNETLFSALLSANGIDEADVTVVPVQYDPSPLINGDVDGFLAYVTNESVTLEQQGYEVENLTYADNGLPFVTESYIASDDSIENMRPQLEAFLYATILGWKDAIADPQGSADLAVNDYGKALGLDTAKQLQQAEVTVPLIVTDETEENGLFTISESLMAQNLETIAATGVTISEEDLFDMSILADVYEAHPELKN